MELSSQASSLFLFFLLCISSSSLSFQPFPKEALPTKSGYLPVDTTSSSAMFYTFYEAQFPSSPSLPLSQSPIVFWLQGGPGCSSMTGNFFELGPYLVTPPHLRLIPNPGAWNRIFGLVFLDNPIGTGFSIASTPQHIPTDQLTVASHLFSAISSFLRLLPPDSASRPLYIAGESYAGKYVPAIASYILNLTINQERKGSPELALNLKGIAIGNGLTDPVTQVQTHSLNAYYSGLINDQQREKLERLQSEAVRLVGMMKWKEATEARSKVLHTLQNMTGLPTLYDFTKTKPYRTDLVAELMNRAGVKEALNANASIEFEECGEAVGDALHEDVMRSTKQLVEEILMVGKERCRVLLYQGQHDLRDGVVSVEAWVKTMRRWVDLPEYMRAKRKVWEGDDGLIAGYVQKWGSLTQAVVLGAGHLVPSDQPISAQAMIEGWILETGAFGSSPSADQTSRPRKPTASTNHFRWQI
ncbi:Serine carboxypeptidase-like 50 [Linum perenne]